MFSQLFILALTSRAMQGSKYAPDGKNTNQK